MLDVNDKVNGDTISPEMWNSGPTEIQNVIESLGIALSGADMHQLGKAIAGYVANGSFYTDSGAANAYVLSVIGLKKAPTAYTDGMIASFIAVNPNTGACTANIGGLGVKNIKTLDGLDPVKGVVSGFTKLVYSSANNWLQVVDESKIGIVGEMRNLKMNVATASATATITADEITVQTALGGKSYKISNISEGINLATTGLGGMDAGSAPVSGDVATYLLYNPTTGDVGTLTIDATASAAPEICASANIPAGYTASALVGVWKTNASRQFIVGYQTGRLIKRLQAGVVTAAVAVGALTPLSIATAVPKNAKLVGGQLQAGNGGAAGFVSAGIASDSIGTGFQTVGGYVTTTTGLSGNFSDVYLATTQTIYYNISDAVSSTYTIYISDYTF